MAEPDRERLKRIWNQTTIPVLVRSRDDKLKVRLPPLPYAGTWLRSGRGRIPKWNTTQRHWTIPKAWFNSVVAQCLATFGRVYIVQPYRAYEKCAPACWNAMGDECECSCMGEHHGSQGPNGRWKVVSDTFAIKWGEESVACRLVTSKR